MCPSILWWRVRQQDMGSLRVYAWWAGQEEEEEEEEEEMVVTTDEDCRAQTMEDG